MDLSVQEADWIFSSPKKLISPLIWEDVPNRKHKSPQRKMECRISIAGAIRRGVFFRVTMMPTYPDYVKFQIEVDQIGVRSHIPLYRLDVSPLSAHTNRLYGQEDLQGAFFALGETHEHIYQDNLADEGTRIRSDSDAIARKI